MKGVSSFLTTMAIMVIIVAVVVGGSILGVILSGVFGFLIVVSLVWLTVIIIKAVLEDIKEEGP